MDKDGDIASVFFFRKYVIKRTALPSLVVVLKEEQTEHPCMLR